MAVTISEKNCNTIAMVLKRFLNHNAILFVKMDRILTGALVKIGANGADGVIQIFFKTM